ncbi:MAG TPA: hypothetical protein VLQ90_02510 [Pyrinomonadaceae bacterium]|nr:hypothetical protein [Pyrinomonadaceae bacterium]
MTKPSRKSSRGPLQFERRHEQLAPISVFVKRVIASLAIALALIAIALGIGISGYHLLGGFGWIDSLLEASMILGGMGPVAQISGDGVKIFASLYALFSGLIFIAVMGVVLSPIVHRFLHKFHVDEEDED